MARIYDVAQQAGTHIEDGGRQVVQRSRQAANSPWAERLARFGLVSKGVLYLVIGGLALWTALGQRGELTDQRGAIHTISEQPFGIALLVALAVGLVGYALMRLAQSLLDLDGEGSGKKALARRAGYLVSGLIHVALAVGAMRLLLGSGTRESGDAAAGSWTAWLMGQPFGAWLVGIVGGIVICVGLAQLYEFAYKAQFRRYLRLDEMDQERELWVTRLGRFGYGARSVVFGLIGAFLILAALNADPGQARGLDGALQSLAQASYGPWLLGVVAAGLAAYGLYCFEEARYRKIGRTPSGASGAARSSSARRRAA
jgi:hypothetical protein